MKNAWTDLDCEILGENLRNLQQALRAPAALILVVKARAYGHGAPAVSRCAWDNGVRWFLVSQLEEAQEVRALLPEARILLLGAVGPEDVPVLARDGIIPVLFSFPRSRRIAAEAHRRGIVLPCHVKVDTGMGRFGLAWEEAAGQIAALQRAGGLRIEGVCSHFASADHRDQEFACTQYRRFRQVLAECAAQGIQFPFRHISNSAAFRRQEEWDFEGVRCGILAYGYGGRGARTRAKTRPFLQWKTTVVQVKRVPAGFPVSYGSTHVAARATALVTINAGYSDGYSRLIGNRGCVLIGGRRAPVVGRVTMNFTVADAGPDATVREGDEVVLLGRQGDESIWADEMARWCRTIPYEVLTSIRQ